MWNEEALKMNPVITLVFLTTGLISAAEIRNSNPVQESLSRQISTDGMPSWLVTALADAKCITDIYFKILIEVLRRFLESPTFVRPSTLCDWIYECGEGVLGPEKEQLKALIKEELKYFIFVELVGGCLVLINCFIKTYCS